MHYTVVKTGEFPNMAFEVFIADTLEDMYSIDIKNAPPSSKCYVEDGNIIKKFTLTIEKEWKEVPIIGLSPDLF